MMSANVRRATQAFILLPYIEPLQTAKIWKLRIERTFKEPQENVSSLFVAPPPNQRSLEIVSV